MLTALQPYHRVSPGAIRLYSQRADDDPDLQFNYKQGVIYRIQMFVGHRDVSLTTSSDLEYNFGSTNAPVWSSDEVYIGPSLSISNNAIAMAFGNSRQFIGFGITFVNLAGTVTNVFYHDGIFLDNIGDGVFAYQWGPGLNVGQACRLTPNSYILATPLPGRLE